MLNKFALFAVSACLLSLTTGCLLPCGGRACSTCDSPYGDACGIEGCGDGLCGAPARQCPQCACHERGPLDLLGALFDCNTYPGCGCGERYWGEPVDRCEPCDYYGNYTGGGCNCGGCNCGGGRTVHAPVGISEGAVIEEGRRVPSPTQRTVKAAPAGATPRYAASPRVTSERDRVAKSPRVAPAPAPKSQPVEIDESDRRPVAARSYVHPYNISRE